MLALYNKYRPKNFNEIVGQSLAKEILIKNIKSTPFHAFLFYGVRGTGKTTMARIFSKALNCSKFIDDICNECATKQLNTNILEVSSSSSRGIDDVKEIFSLSTFIPFNSGKRIIIFDEAQMLTNESFGFLLKNIEECFQHVTYIFVTTEINKIPDTIVSRCQKIPFFVLKEKEAKSIGESILKKENFNISSDILNTLVKKSKNIPRDLLVLLEEIKDIKEEKYIDLLINHEKKENFDFLYELIKNKDFSSIENFIDKKFNDSIDWKSFFFSFLDYLSEIKSYEKSISNFYTNFSKNNNLFFSRSYVIFIFRLIFSDES